MLNSVQNLVNSLKTFNFAVKFMGSRQQRKRPEQEELTAENQRGLPFRCDAPNVRFSMNHNTSV